MHRKAAAMKTNSSLRRVAAFQAEIARRLREMARDAGDMAVVAVCNRVRQAWLGGERVERADLLLIGEVWEAVRG
jgi:hypothetical protein